MALTSFSCRGLAPACPQRCADPTRRPPSMPRSTRHPVADPKTMHLRRHDTNDDAPAYPFCRSEHGSRRRGRTRRSKREPTRWGDAREPPMRQEGRLDPHPVASPAFAQPCTLPAAGPLTGCLPRRRAGTPLIPPTPASRSLHRSGGTISLMAPPRRRRRGQLEFLLAPWPRCLKRSRRCLSLLSRSCSCSFGVASLSSRGASLLHHHSRRRA